VKLISLVLDDKVKGWVIFYCPVKFLAETSSI